MSSRWQSLWLLLVLLLSPPAPGATADGDVCKASRAAFASLGLLDIAANASAVGPLCGGRCCDAPAEAALSRLARRELANLLRNHLAASPATSAIDTGASGACGSGGRLRLQLATARRVLNALPAAVSAAATPDCLTARTRSRYCRLCVGDAAASAAGGGVAGVAALRICLAPLAPLAAAWDRLVDAIAASCVSAPARSQLTALRGLLGWQGLLRAECRPPAAACLLSGGGGGGIVGGVVGIKPPPVVARLLARLRVVADSTGGARGAARVDRGRHRRRRRRTSVGGGGSGHGDIRGGGGGGGGNASGLGSGHTAPMRSIKPGLTTHHHMTSMSTLPELTTNGTMESILPEPTPTSGSGDSEAPPQQPLDLYPPLPQPGSAPHPDIWLPKSADDDVGGAVGNRGEGSVHWPQMLMASMRGQRRECLYADAARCNGGGRPGAAGLWLLAGLAAGLTVAAAV